MAKLSISAAWNEAADILKREGGLLYLITFALVALPGAVYQALNPQPLPPAQAEPNAMMLLIVPVLLVVMLGTLTLSLLALGRENVVGSAIAAAARRLPALFGAVLILALGLCLVFIPTAYALGPGDPQRPIVRLATGGLLLLLLVVWAKLLVTTAVAAAEAGGPIAILRRSWTLTGGYFWKLMAFVGLAAVVLLVATMAAGAVGGLLALFLAGPLVPGSLSMFLFLLVTALVNAALTLPYTVLTARIYVQLAGGATTGT